MALTAAQLREHVGRMFIRGFGSLLADGETRISISTIVLWIKNHKTDSAFSNEADRSEACITMLRELFLRTTGINSDASLVNRRIFRKWVDQMLGYGEGILIEPQGS